MSANTCSVYLYGVADSVSEPQRLYIRTCMCTCVVLCTCVILHNWHGCRWLITVAITESVSMHVQFGCLHVHVVEFLQRANTPNNVL